METTGKTREEAELGWLEPIGGQCKWGRRVDFGGVCLGAIGFADGLCVMV